MGGKERESEKEREQIVREGNEDIHACLAMSMGECIG